MLVPSDNPLTPQKIELGRALFYDKKLSRNETMSCGSCHQQQRAFSDGRSTSLGSTGEEHPRNALPLANVGYMRTLNWANPLVSELEDQLLVPLFGQHPVELGFSGRDQELLSRLGESEEYIRMFQESFPDEEEPISLRNLARAIAAFERTIISGNSAYDKYVYQGNVDALSKSAKRGMNLFFSERLFCDHCHGGFNFSGPTVHENLPSSPRQFENNGLYNIGGRGAYPPDNTGLYAFSGNISDMGRFRPPSLRNIELTGPYMHDGSIATLGEVLDHYARGGRKIESGPHAGDGRDSPYKSSLISGFRLTSEEKDDLIEFLKSLTDWDLVSNPSFSDPHSDTP